MKAIQQSSAKKISSSLQKISSDSPVSGKVVYPGKLQSGEFFDREIAVRRVSESINRINDISSERDATNKTRHPIILASAMSCIGKNTFGETVLREIAQMEPFGSEFGVALSEMNYLTVNFKGGGDGFAAEDIPLSPDQRFVVRVLGQVCCISQGAAGLRSMLRNPDQSLLDAHVEEMRTAGLDNVASLLIRYSESHDLRLEEIILTMATDNRKVSGVENG